MGFTNGFAAYAAINESGFNKLIRNVALARPHYLNYATAGLGGGSTSVTLLPPLTVPGAGIGLQYEIKVARPVLDFFPQTQPLPPGLTLQPNQFAIATVVEICVVCADLIRGRGGADQGKDQGRGPLICAKLQIWAIGHPTSTPVNATDRLIGLVVDEIILKDVGNLEKLAECISKDALNALLQKIRYLVEKHVFGAFTFFLADGPRIEDDQLKVWGGVS